MSEQSDPSTWPLTLDAVVERLLGLMSDADKEVVRNTPEDKLIRFHFPWGMGIRNEFGLWRGNTQLLESCGGEHPDDASSVIIRAVWERLQTIEQEQ